MYDFRGSPPLSQVIASSDTSAFRSEFIHLLSLPYKSHPWPVHETEQIESFFPTSDVIEELIDLFFLRWYRICPLFHRPTWSTKNAPPILLASMASIGASFLDREDAHEFADNLSELTKRTIRWMADKDGNYLRKEYFITAMLLQSIYSLGSGNKRLYEAADTSRSFLVTNARATGLFNLSIEDCVNWTEYERKKRVAWMIFEYDCTISTLTSTRPYMSLHDLSNHLPCDEEVWDGHIVWHDGIHYDVAVASLLNGQVDPALNWYSRRILAQALGRTLWDYAELESSTTFKNVGLLSTPKDRLLSALNLLQGGSNGDEMVHVSICMTIASYSKLYMNRLMELMTSAARQKTPAKIEKMQAELNRDPRHSRFLAFHAAQILSVVKRYPYHAPCETMRVFMAGLFLFWFAQSAAAVQPGAFIARLDLLPWEHPEPLDWIENGGLACIEGTNGFVKVCGDDGADAVIEAVIELLRSLRVWGLAEKFCRVLKGLK